MCLGPGIIQTKAPLALATLYVHTLKPNYNPSTRSSQHLVKLVDFELPLVKVQEVLEVAVLELAVEVSGIEFIGELARLFPLAQWLETVRRIR